MDGVKVSVITVCLNGVKYIEQTINSVLQQDYPNVEYIIIDGQSDDGTLEIINKYRSGVKLVSEKDDGIYDAMNKGVEFATGELIGFMNVGDSYAEGAITSIVNEYLVSNADIIYGDAIQVYDDREEYISYKDLNFENYFSGNQIIHQSVFTKTELLRKHKFNTSFKLLADYDFFIRRYCDFNSFGYANRLISYYRIGGASSTKLFEVAYEKKELLMNVLEDYPRLRKKHFETVRDGFFFDMFELHVENMQDYKDFSRAMFRHIVEPFSKVVVFGTGQMAQKYYDYLGVTADYFIDNDKKKANKVIFGKKIHGVNHVSCEKNAAILILAKNGQKEMKHQIENMDCSEDNICLTLFQIGAAIESELYSF